MTPPLSIMAPSHDRIDQVQKVEISDRLVGSMATLVQGQWGMSPMMQKYPWSLCSCDVVRHRHPRHRDRQEALKKSGSINQDTARDREGKMGSRRQRGA